MSDRTAQLARLAPAAGALAAGPPEAGGAQGFGSGATFGAPEVAGSADAPVEAPPEG